MQKIPIKYAEAGMMLAKPVETDDGRVLVGKGTKLSENMLSQLKKREIAAITVEGHPVDLPGENTKSYEDLIKELDDRFSKVDGDPLMDNLKDVLKRHIASIAQSNAPDMPPE